MGAWSWLGLPANTLEEGCRPSHQATAASADISSGNSSSQTARRQHPALCSWLPGSCADPPTVSDGNSLKIRLGLSGSLSSLLEIPQSQPCGCSSLPGTLDASQAASSPAYRPWQANQYEAHSVSGRPVSGTPHLQPFQPQPAASQLASSSRDEGLSSSPAFAMQGSNELQTANAATPPPDTAARSQQPRQAMLQTVKLLLAGGLAGAISKTATAPLARLTILYQVCLPVFAPAPCFKPSDFQVLFLLRLHDDAHPSGLQ